MNKLKFFVIKNEFGDLAQCNITEKPLMDIDKKRLNDLLRIMKFKDDSYKKCKIVKMHECFW